MNPGKPSLVAAVLGIAFLAGLPTPAQGGNPDRKEPPPRTHEGAISVTGDGSVKMMTVLGGDLGRQIVEGVEVGLFVLQAESPARLEEGARGPTHVFHLTFREADGGGRVDGVAGALVIEGAGRSGRVEFKPFETYHRAVTRLEKEGEYRISVEFTAGETERRTSPFPFRYARKKQAGHQH